MSLADKTCVPCRGGIPALTRAQFEPLFNELDQWQIENDKKLSKSFKFENFKQAMDLATDIAQIAEKERHHPDLIVRWGELKIDLWTHAIDGLTESDFVLAAKIDRLVEARSKPVHHGKASV